MSFTSYAWVAHDERTESIRAANTYLGIAVIGGLIATAIASAQRQRLRQDVSVAATYQKA